MVEVRVRLEQHLFQHRFQIGPQLRFSALEGLLQGAIQPCQTRLVIHARHQTHRRLSFLPGLGHAARLDAETVVEPQTTAGAARNLFAVGIASRSIVEEVDDAKRASANLIGPEPAAAFGTRDHHQEILSPRRTGAMRLSVQRVYTLRTITARQVAKRVYWRGYVRYEYRNVVPAPPFPPITPERAPSSANRTLPA